MNFDELVTAATVGVGQRPVRPDALPVPADAYAHVLSDDPVTAVLDAVALLDAGRRAGGFAPVPTTLPAPAPTETQPLLSASAADSVLHVLNRDRVLLFEFLHAASGRRMPPRTIPELLTAAARETSLRAPILGVVGERGRWLAGLNPQWRAVLAARTAVEVRADDATVWATGTAGERRAWLAAMRRADPARARELLAAGWSKETGEGRAEMLAQLGIGLGPDDEEFLEHALDDRREAVRQLAAALLAALPASDYRTRTAARATAQVRLDRKAMRRRLVVSLPPEPDTAALRDGVPVRAPHRGIGDGAWRLVQIVAAGPLSAWQTALDADPATIVELPVDEYGAELHAGWRLAAAREGSAEWARALLRRPAPALNYVGDQFDRLLRALPIDERADRAVVALRADQVPVAVQALNAVPAPWPADLVGVVLDHTTRQCASRNPAPPDDLLATLSHRIPHDLIGRRDPVAVLRDLAGHMLSRSGETPMAMSWTSALQRAADVIALRRQFHRAVQSAGTTENQEFC